MIPIEQLSDGFQLTANWIGDLLFRITQTSPLLTKDPFSADFILLIDEIALHLHPAWQRTILLSIEKIFPYAQIIATTHSPFVAQQAGKGELLTLIRQDKEIISHHPDSDPRKLLIHQVITSDIMGVPTDESIAMEQWKDEKRTEQQKRLVQDAYTIESSPFKVDLSNIDDFSELAESSYRTRASEKFVEENTDRGTINDLIKKLKV